MGMFAMRPLSDADRQFVSYCVSSRMADRRYIWTRISNCQFRVPLVADKAGRVIFVCEKRGPAAFLFARLAPSEITN